MIVETLPLVGSTTPLRNHIMVIGDVPLRMSQTRVMLAPSIIYAGEPIWTSMSPGGIVGGGGINDPSSMSGGTPIRHKARIVEYVYALSKQYYNCKLYKMVALQMH